jgi:hypothetical protein
MMQVWLVLLAIFLEYFASHVDNVTSKELLRMMALGSAVISIVLVFVNGGTTG